MGARESRTVERGFTLVEMLVVVAMVGVLATLAVYGVRKYVFASKSSEALAMVNSIKAHEEAYKDETYAYLNVTAGYAALHPAAPDGQKRAWWTGTASDTNWRQLGVDANGPVTFGYACIAGAGGTAVTPPTTQLNLNYPSPANEPWYVILAQGDQNGDGVRSNIVASSFTREVYVENDSE
jgi:type IV pilus assembly protein PilA